jgi:hypothetical protein
MFGLSAAHPNYFYGDPGDGMPFKVDGFNCLRNTTSTTTRVDPLRHP